MTSNLAKQLSRPALELDHSAQLRIWRAMSRMPYSGGASWFPSWRASTADPSFTADQLAEFLEGLGERLEVASAENCAREDELRELRAQRDAVRAFLGTGE